MMGDSITSLSLLQTLVLKLRSELESTFIKLCLEQKFQKKLELHDSGINMNNELPVEA